MTSTQPTDSRTDTARARIVLWGGARDARCSVDAARLGARLEEDDRLLRI